MTVHPSACRCEACSRWRHPSGRTLTERDIDTLCAWASSWPAHPSPDPPPVSPLASGRADADRTT